MEEKEREEKIGRTVAGFARFLFAVVLYVIYRLVWRIVFKIIEWAGRQ